MSNDEEGYSPYKPTVKKEQTEQINSSKQQIKYIKCPRCGKESTGKFCGDCGINIESYTNKSQTYIERCSCNNTDFTYIKKGLDIKLALECFLKGLIIQILSILYMAIMLMISADKIDVNNQGTIVLFGLFVLLTPIVLIIYGIMLCTISPLKLLNGYEDVYKICTRCGHKRILTSLSDYDSNKVNSQVKSIMLGVIIGIAGIISIIPIIKIYGG